ncbi:MAG: hypothetical protein KAT83_00200 [Candidatus Aenigmarchaeota archaeon]|nr:hypothetical protein [Candidatus Aenigmarchaeota archaeon]
MTFEARSSEKILLAIMVALVLIGFLVLWGGVILGTPNATVISIGLLVISAAQIITFLFLMKIYERIRKACP